MRKLTGLVSASHRHCQSTAFASSALPNETGDDDTEHEQRSRTLVAADVWSRAVPTSLDRHGRGCSTDLRRAVGLGRVLEEARWRSESKRRSRCRESFGAETGMTHSKHHGRRKPVPAHRRRARLDASDSPAQAREQRKESIQDEAAAGVCLPAIGATRAMQSHARSTACRR